MLDFTKKDKSAPIIQVIGVGGGGNNAVNHMWRSGLKNINYLVCNTDYYALDNSPIDNILQLGPELTDGLGAGCNPEKGKQAALESVEAIRFAILPTTKMVFVTAGMGGGTGTGAAPIIVQEAASRGLLTVAVVSIPFKNEGKKKRKFAHDGIKEVMQYADATIVISNDNITKEYGDLTVTSAFAKADDILLKAVKGISDIITYPGYIGVDFEDVNTVLKSSGLAFMSSGVAKGEGRAIKAVEQALFSPLLNDYDLKGARKILFNISSCTANEITMNEFDQLQEYVRERTHQEANIIFGLVYDDALEDEVSITILIAGLKMDLEV